MWEHAAAQQSRKLLGIDRIVFVLPAMKSFHIQGMPQDKGNRLVSTQVGEPVPGEDTFDSDHQAVTIGGNGLEEWCWSGRHIAVQQNVAILTYDTAVHGAGMPVDAAVNWVLIGVESH
jgi:hypothetical protein